jgi:NADH:ubiquinone oxidoreductase subunit 3 (subunit A)
LLGKEPRIDYFQFWETIFAVVIFIGFYLVAMTTIIALILVGFYWAWKRYLEHIEKKWK